MASDPVNSGFDRFERLHLRHGNFGSQPALKLGVLAAQRVVLKRISMTTRKLMLTIAFSAVLAAEDIPARRTRSSAQSVQLRAGSAATADLARPAGRQ
jgi:hypothetical protein